jgi:hypothetical protein
MQIKPVITGARQDNIDLKDLRCQRIILYPLYKTFLRVDHTLNGQHYGSEVVCIQQDLWYADLVLIIY